MSSLTDQLNVFDSAKIEWKYEDLTVYFARFTVKKGHLRHSRDISNAQFVMGEIFDKAYVFVSE